MEHLSNSPRATDFICDLLKIIEKSMLVIEAKDRASAASLEAEFDELMRKREDDQSYYPNKDDSPTEASTVSQAETDLSIDHPAEGLTIPQPRVLLPDLSIAHPTEGFTLPHHKVVLGDISVDSSTEKSTSLQPDAVPRDLSIQALEAINRGSVTIPTRVEK